MNKQELYNKVEDLDKFCLGIRKYVALNEVIYLIKQLDKPQEVTVPQFVADWIERSKQEKRNLRNALNNGGEKMRLWFLDLENYDTFARAWLDGYEVEKEKRYLVKMKGENIAVRLHHTKEELIEAGFEEVFDSSLFEVEEKNNE